MSITETEKIDIVASRPDSSVVRLVITDHLTWDDFDTHARLLQEKINTYLAFVESGQLYQLQEPMIPNNPEIHITLAIQHPPSLEARALFKQIRDFLEHISLHFETEVNPSHQRV